MDKTFNPVGWFELYVSDMARAKAFYSAMLQRELFDLPASPGIDMQMAVFAQDMNVSGASGALVKSGMQAPGPGGTLVYFSCMDCAVEAARAGEQGRGFAVVASEVRSLAGRSADAAKEIKTLITDSVGRVDQGTALVDQAGSTMNEVVTSIRRVTDIMGEISAASSEQSAGVGQVSEAVTSMDQATQQNAALVEEMAAAAASLRAQAQDLVQAVAVFRLAQDARTTLALPAA